MNRKIRRTIMAVVFLAIVLAPLVWAATTAKTTFVFYVATSRGITATYGGQCTSTAFFFNETDANFDPDTDGNAAKVKPNYRRRNDAPIWEDYNFVGVGTSGDRNKAFSEVISTIPPTSPLSVVTQFTNTEYTNVSTDNTSYATETSGSGTDTPTMRFVFKANVDKQLISDMNFEFFGSAQKTSDLLVCSSGGAGQAYDINIFIWNYQTNVYQQWLGDSQGGANIGQGAQMLSGSLIQRIANADINDYIGPDNNITIYVQGTPNDGDGQSCLHADYAHLQILRRTLETNFCQSSTLSPLTITNAGNVDINVDANFSSAFTGTDYNAVLKVWQGSSGCGADGNGLGGWQDTCTYASPADVNTAPNTTNCRQYSKVQAAQYGRIATQLTAESAQQLCFSGDFNGFVPAGDHNNTFNACVGSECTSDVTDSMLGWWKFNEGSGTNVDDNTFYGNNGTIPSGITWLSGISCPSLGCVDFDGANQVIRVGGPGIDFNLGNYNKITVAFWLNADTGGATNYPMSIGDPSQPFPFAIGIETTKTLLSRISLDGGSVTNSSYWWGSAADTNLQSDEWHHYAFTYDGDSGNQSFYVDGIVTYSDSPGAAGSFDRDGSACLVLGAADTGTCSPFKYFDGGMDDLRIYNRALSYPEIKRVVAHPQ